MEVFNNLNLNNVFGDINNHASSNSINFTSNQTPKKSNDLETSSGKIPSYSDLKKNQQQDDNIKAFSSKNLVNVKPKPKQKQVKDPLSYITYSSSSNSLKNISDPLSQMKPISTFGYPTKDKNNSNTKKEDNTIKETTPLKESKETNSQNVENNQKEENAKKEEKNNNTSNAPIVIDPLSANINNVNLNSNNNTNNNTNINIKSNNSALMTSIFGKNPNTNNNANSANASTTNNSNNLNTTNPLISNQPITNNLNNTNNYMMNLNMMNLNMMNMNYMMNMQNMTNMPNMQNMTNMTNIQNMTNNQNIQNMTNMTNVNNLNVNLNYQNMSALNNQNINYQSIFGNINNQAKIPTNMGSYNMMQVGNPALKRVYNELGAVCKPGDLYTDTNLIREKCGIMKCEKIKDLTKASLNFPEKRYMGVFVLTEFRLIYQIENEKYLNYNYSEDYFKIPLFSIQKIEKIQDKRMSYDAYPLEITLKDTRVIKFHVWDQQRFYYNLSDAINPRSPMVWQIFTEEYNKANFKDKNITNGWYIYDPIKEFSRQGVTETNDLGLRYCRINRNFEICPTYPQFLIEPSAMSDEELRQSSSYRTKGRLPIFTYYYDGNRNKRLKGIPTLWRSAQNKRGIMGNKRCPSDEKLLNVISEMGGRLYIYDCRPKLNALVNRVNGGGYENVDHYNNVTLNFCEIDNIHKARKALTSLYSLCLSNKIDDYNNFWTTLEQSGWFQFIYLMLKNANEISKILQNNNSVLIHCSDGWDRTAQLSSLSQMLLDPFYRTINGFAVLVEKDWLSFGHQFGLRNGFAEKEKQDQASPIFLQFLDAVHQLLEQFPNAFEFNEKFLLFLAKNYNLNLYGTFMFNNEKERVERNAKENTASVWTEIFKDLKPYLNVYYDANSVTILEPNYSYYNIKLWTTLFMENNIYLENRNFYISDIDKNLSFKSKQEFFAYKKKEDENKYMNYQTKYEELLRVAADAYFVIKDNTKIFDKLNDESKKLIEELKPKFDNINKNRILEEETKEQKLDTPKEGENENKDSNIDIEKKENKNEEEGETKGQDNTEENKEGNKSENNEDKKEEEKKEEEKKEEEKNEVKDGNESENKVNEETEQIDQ